MEESERTNPIQDFIIKTLNGMAYGLFGTLIIGTIFAAIGYLFSLNSANCFCNFMVKILGSTDKKQGVSFVLQILTGAGIGCGIALAMKFDVLRTITLLLVGELASYFSLSTRFVTENIINDGAFQIGDPLTIYLVCIAAALGIKYILRKKTPFDLILIPFLGITLGLVGALLIRFPAIYVTYGIQWLINEGTKASPFFAGIVVSALMGMALTAPISSAAIGAMLFTIPDNLNYIQAIDSGYEGLIVASGAAIVGCCTQMIGFMVQSSRDNKIGTVISIGLGTSMLQFKNIIKKPIVWLPTIFASMILGPIATCLVKPICLGSNAGMGTAGLVGQIGTIISMTTYSNSEVWRIVVSLVVLELVAPAILVFLIDLLFRELNLIQDGDLIV